jgi:hypothetical protein
MQQRPLKLFSQIPHVKGEGSGRIPEREGSFDAVPLSDKRQGRQRSTVSTWGYIEVSARSLQP